MLKWAVKSGGALPQENAGDIQQTPPPKHGRSKSEPAPNPRIAHVRGSDPLLQTARGRLQTRRSKLNEQISRELRLRSGAENLFKVTTNKKMRDTIAQELSRVNANLQLLKEELADLNNTVAIYQSPGAGSGVPMIPLGLKETKDIDFKGVFKEYIDEHYREDGEKYSKSFQQLNELRQACRTPMRNESGIELLIRYYNHLYFVDRRFFPPNKRVNIQFEWYDSLTGLPFCQHAIGFEKGSILFNIGALYTQIGARQDRGNVEGIDTAVENFQKAAAAFRCLQENFSHAPSQDMCHEMLAVFSKLMLSQAQECIFERRLIEEGQAVDTTNNISLAHEAAMVSSAYMQTLSLMGTPTQSGTPTHVETSPIQNGTHTPVGSPSQTRKVGDAEPLSLQLPSSWRTMIEVKCHYFRALSHYHAAVAILGTLNLSNDAFHEDDEDGLAAHFARLHVRENASSRLTTISGCLTDKARCRQIAQAHLRDSVIGHEEALRWHSENQQLRRMDTLQGLLKYSHDRSLLRFAELDDEDDFSEPVAVPNIQPDSRYTVMPEYPDFAKHGVDDLFHKLGPLNIFSARHRWTPRRHVYLTRGEDEEFGFVVRGNSPVIITTVSEDSLADRAGVRPGDFVVAVGRTDTRWSRHAAVVSLIRAAGCELSFHLITPLDRNYLHPDASPVQRIDTPLAVQNTPEMCGTLRKGAPGRINGNDAGKGNTTPGVSKKTGTWRLRKRRSASKDRKHTVINDEHSR